MLRSDAIAIIEGMDMHDTRYDEARRYFEDELKQGLISDHEKRAEHYYYLLRVLMKKHVMVDNPVTQQYFELMKKECTAQERTLLTEIQLPTDIRHMQMKAMQLKAFYKIVERYFSSLEISFDHYGFFEFREKAYVEKMLIRAQRFKLQKQWGKYGTYKIFEWTSYYGVSLFHWMCSASAIIVISAFVYLLLDYFTHFALFGVQSMNVMDYLMLSTRLFTLSYSPVVHGFLPQVVVMFELCAGYGMFALLVAIILRRF